MDQNSTNGAGTEKRNWRERLGIGAKEMPRLSDEFRTPQPAASAPPPAAGTAKPAPRAPQPVTKPAPMAPRPSAQKPQAAAAAPTPRPKAPPPPPPQPAPSAQDALAEKLRAQRAAAERLAEQRVQAARERAEGKAKTRPPEVPPVQRPAAPPPAATEEPSLRPRFSFADEDRSGRKDGRLAPEPAPAPPRPALSSAAPPLTPPRPALGGERNQPSFLRPATGGSRQQPPLRQDSHPAYRPVDPATGYAPPPRYQPPPPRGYTAEQGYYPQRQPTRRAPPPPPVEPHYDGYPGEELEPEPRAQPRLGRPAAPRGRARPPEEDYEEVFEGEAAPRQRASAHDYQTAYRETEAGYEEEHRRSGGPWLLLLALLLAALVTMGVVWFYNTKMRTVTTTEGGNGNVPVVTAPEQPAKVAPETPAEAPGAVPALKKKQIYDRIVGDQEVTGEQVVPTEEPPVPPAAADSTQSDQGTADIPAPDAATDGAALPVPDEPAPLPLPPPPGNDVQGSLEQQGSETIAAASADPNAGLAAPPGAASDTNATDVASLPPPENDPAGAVDASGETADPVVTAPPPKKKEPAAKAKAAPAPTKKKTTASAPSTSAEPVVLVPPSQAAPPSQGGTTISEPVSQQGGEQPEKKRKTLFDLFSGNSSDAGATAAPQQVDETLVASLQTPSRTETVAPAPKPAPAPAPAPAPQASSGGGGYVVQLASFRSESEAQNEYGRLKSRYPDVVGGLAPRINQASLAGSTRYNLGLGPMATRDQASRVCDSLFAKGERDCLVRSQ